jgi:hypothetical protein
MLENLLRRASFFDVLIVLVGSFAIVGFWRGTWNLMDFYVFPENIILSQIVTITFGVLILILLSLYKGWKNK